MDFNQWIQQAGYQQDENGFWRDNTGHRLTEQEMLDAQSQFTRAFSGEYGSQGYGYNDPRAMNGTAGSPQITLNGQAYRQTGEAAPQWNPEQLKMFQRMGIDPSTATIKDPEHGYLLPENIWQAGVAGQAQHNKAHQGFLDNGAALMSMFMGPALGAVAGGGLAGGLGKLGINAIASGGGVSPLGLLSSLGGQIPGVGEVGDKIKGLLGGSDAPWGVNPRDIGGSGMGEDFWGNLYEEMMGGQHSDPLPGPSFPDPTQQQLDNMQMSELGYMNGDGQIDWDKVTEAAGGGTDGSSYDPGGNLGGGLGSQLSGSLAKLLGLPTGAGAALLKSLGGAFGGGSGGQGSILGNLIPGLLESRNQRQFQQDLLKGFQDAADKADPFRSQRPFYQDELKKMYTDPNYLQNSPVFQNIMNPAMRQTEARAAAQGYNQSGNLLHELERTGVETAAKYFQPQEQITAQNAGANFGPGFAGTLLGQGTQAAAQAGLSSNAGIGYALDPVLGGVLGPSSRQQQQQAVNGFLSSFGKNGQTPNIVNGGSGGGPNLLSSFLS